MEEEDVRGDRGLSVFRLRAVSRLTLVVRCTEIGYSVSTQVLGFRFGCGWCCVVGFLFGCCWFCVLLLCVSAWWNRGIADEVTMASYGRAVTGTAVMARSANEEKKKKGREAKDGGEDNHKERGIVGLAGAKDALDAERSVTRGEAPDSGEE